VEDRTGLNTLICKGAVDEVIGLCSRVEIKGEVAEILPEHDEQRRKIADALNGQGFRVLALAYRRMPGSTDDPTYSVRDEADLTLLGFLAFFDPPKKDARESLDELAELRVSVKVLTGDNEIIAAYLCREVGIPVDRILLGPGIESMSDGELSAAVDSASVFARLTPAHKERIIRALRSPGPDRRAGHVVGFLGDGINDAPALKASDVGITVNGAVDIAKESSDIILLENSLLVLKQGVLEGRRVFGNIVKYIKMAASSNFGNMFSVVGASAFLPFLPMLPIQVLTTNLLYDVSQTAIPSDKVDAEWLEKPRQWSIRSLLRFILLIGPISSLFDFLTFFVMLYAFGASDNPELFRTGWFVESLCTQSLIVHVIRTEKVPIIESRASAQLAISTVLVAAAGILLTVSSLAPALGFAALPAGYWLFLAAIASGYAVLTQLAKSWFIKRFGE
jgi:P-type Mg2+ transporter